MVFDSGDTFPTAASRFFRIRSHGSEFLDISLSEQQETDRNSKGEDEREKKGLERWIVPLTSHLFKKKQKKKHQAPPPSSSTASAIPDDSLYPPMPACTLACSADRPPAGVTVPFDTAYATGSDDLPLSDELLARPEGAPSRSPEQVKVQLAVDGGVVVSWVTGEASLGAAADLRRQMLEGTGASAAASNKPPPSVVRFGRSPDALDRTATAPSDPVVVPGSPSGGANGAVDGLIGTADKKKKGGSGSGGSNSPLPPQPRRYLQSYGPDSYLSGWSHHVLLRSPSQITPGERVYYKVGSGEEWSEVMSFVAPPRSAAAVAAEAKANAKKGAAKGASSSPSPYPLMLSFIGDLGTTENSTSTLRHVMKTSSAGVAAEMPSGGESPDGGGATNSSSSSSSAALFVVGDLVYADNYRPDGSPRDFRAWDLREDSTYQPRWDAWARMTSALGFAELPVAAIVGNHDVEAEKEERAYKSFLSRFEQASAGIGGSESPSSTAPPPSPEDPTLWAKDVGPARIVGLNTYAPYGPGSVQRTWLEKALKISPEARNSTTPWLIVLMHAPWYTSYAIHYREVECMRASLEPLLARAGVDLVFSGHVHAYERTTRVLDHNPSPCGPVHVTVGDGGNAERLYTTFADGWGIPEGNKAARAKACPSKKTGDACAARVPGPYCSSEQPPWSAFREPSFGHGTLVLESAERAVWRWHRNQDGERVVSDEFVVLRGGATCKGFVDGGE